MWMAMKSMKSTVCWLCILISDICRSYCFVFVCFLLFTKRKEPWNTTPWTGLLVYSLQCATSGSVSGSVLLYHGQEIDSQLDGTNSWPNDNCHLESEHLIDSWFSPFWLIIIIKYFKIKEGNCKVVQCSFVLISHEFTSINLPSTSGRFIYSRFV